MLPLKLSKSEKNLLSRNHGGDNMSSSKILCEKNPSDGKIFLFIVEPVLLILP